MAVSSEGALRLRCSASSVACASEFKPLYRRESVREREPRERGQGFRVPVCACAGIGVYARVLGPTQLSSNCHRSETCSLRNQRNFFWPTRREAWRRQLAASLAPAVTTVRAPRLDRVACDRLADRCAATAGAARRENNGFNRKTNGHVWLSQPRTKLNSQTILCLLRTACVLLLLRVFRWAPIYGAFRPARAPL